MKASILKENRINKRFIRVVASFLLLIAAGSGSAQESINLTNVLLSKLPGDNVQINLVTDGSVGLPGSFSTDTPARIAFDFFGMKEQLPKNLIPVQVGLVDSVVAVETPDRTRVIINLYDTARYEVLESSDGYAITVFNDNSDNSAVKLPEPFASRPDLASEIQVSNIDFRRSEAGGGSLIVDLNDDNVTIDTREQDGEIVIDLLGINIPPELERRLDVVDFATPVQTVDAFQNGENVRLVIAPQGKYQHLSYQAGTRFTLVVDPIIETPEEIKNAEDAALGFTGERLSINFQKIDVRSALAVIADFTGINFVTSDSVGGEITINLKDVPWDQALEVIMRTKGLSKRQTGNVIWVAPSREIQEIEEEELKANAIIEEFAPLVTELIEINYARAGDIANVIQNVGTSRSSSSEANSGLSSFSSAGSTSTNTTSSSDNSLLTARGSVTADSRTNSLLVQDVAHKIKELRVLIARLDKPVRQVLIETRIVQASDNFSRELGVRLGFQRLTENARFPGSDSSNIGDVITGGSLESNAVISDSRFDDEDGLIFGRNGPALNVDLGANGIGTANPAAFAIELFRAGSGFANLISLELSALEADGRGKIVASPRLVTANQREATIRQGEERIFQTIVTAAGGGGGGTTTEEAILELQVTPQITPDDRVIMDVRVTQEAFLPTPDGGASAALSTQEVITQVVADNGETIIIGGIYQEDTANAVIKVPILGDIPIIGNLFRTKSVQRNRLELLIFLTPKIISPKLNLG